MIKINLDDFILFFLIFLFLNLNFWLGYYMGKRSAEKEKLKTEQISIQKELKCIQILK